MRVPSAMRWAALAIVGAAVLWGTTGTAQELGPDTSSPLAVGTLRIALGGLVLAAVAGGRLRGPRGPGVVAGLAVAAVGVAAYQVAFFTATDRTGVAVGTLVAIGSGPAFAGVADGLLARRWPGAAWLVATSLAVLGCAFLVTAGAGTAEVDPVGVIAALAAGASYACYSLGAKRLLAAGWSTAAAMAAIFCGGGVVLVPLLATQPLGWVGEPGGVAMVVYLGVVTVGVAYLLYGHGLRSLAVSTVVTLSLAEPLTATLLGVVVLGEHLGPPGWVGASLVMAGLALTGADVTRLRRAVSDEGQLPRSRPVA